MKLRVRRYSLEAGRQSTTSAQGFVLTMTVLGGILLTSLSAQLPGGSTLSFFKDYRAAYRTIWPQGWSFFADTPDSQVVTAYRLSADRTVNGSAITSSMSAQNLWGLRRTGTAQLYQALYLVRAIPQAYWVDCTQPLSHDCLSQAKLAHVSNNFQPAQFCGILALVRAQRSRVQDAQSATAVQYGSVAVVQLDCPQ